MPTKIRIIPTLLYKDFGLVKGSGFDSWRRIGCAMQAIKVYNMREVDELVFLDISATLNGTGPDFSLVAQLAAECFMPFAVGGGISKLEHVQELLRVGADKVVINTSAHETPDLIRRVSDRFGAQCVIVSIDSRRTGTAAWEVYTQSGRVPTGMEPTSVARMAQARGAGELLITSIERDGTMAGYDLDLIRAVSEAVSIPVIASGGAGAFAHLAEALTTGGATSVALSSLFLFTECTPNEAKRYLHNKGFSVRMIQ
jgi:imidazole glycerol-phosphate synthase subunit HisF